MRCIHISLSILLFFILPAFYPVYSAEVAITVDDLVTSKTPLLDAETRNEKILAALDRHSHLKAMLFVCGEKADNSLGKTLIAAWGKRGHAIANHSYSHLYFHSPKISLGLYQDDFLRNDSLVRSFSHFQPFFRFPFLKEGNTLEKRDGMRKLLKTKAYRNGFVTIDASDWYVDERMRKRLAADPQADLSGYRDFYLKHIWDRATYYDNLAKKLLGREVKHTLLIHHSLLNALFLDDLISMFKKNGWKPIDALEAYQDPVFLLEPKTLPAGESLIWALAKGTGKYDDQLRYPAEDGEYEKSKMDQLGL